MSWFLAREATRYDRRVSRRVRLLVIPAVLFVAVGDAYQGETVFQQTCAGCHGAGGKGGGIGPRLAGAAIPLAVAKAQIDNGGGAMPPRLVTGQKERDVLAYLA